MSITVELPIKTESLNVKEHWAKKAKRVKAHRTTASFHLKHFGARTPPELPIHLTLTRIAPRPVDRWDSLPGGMKAVIDGICDWLGVDDADPRLTIDFQQERAKDYRVRITVTQP